MKLIEIHVHGVYSIEIEEGEDITDAVEQSFIDMFNYDPWFEIENWEEC